MTIDAILCHALFPPPPAAAVDSATVDSFAPPFVLDGCFIAILRAVARVLLLLRAPPAAPTAPTASSAIPPRISVAVPPPPQPSTSSTGAQTLPTHNLACSAAWRFVARSGQEKGSELTWVLREASVGWPGAAEGTAECTSTTCNTDAATGGDAPLVSNAAVLQLATAVVGVIACGLASGRCT